MKAIDRLYEEFESESRKQERKFCEICGDMFRRSDYSYYSYEWNGLKICYKCLKAVSNLKRGDF